MPCHPMNTPKPPTPITSQDLTQLSEAQLLEGFLAVLRRPGDLTIAQLDEIRVIDDELKARQP